jgi:F-type H+-transporting ATPase subunit c
MKFPVISILKAAALLGAGLSMGAGAIGSGFGSGFPAGGACLGIARQPEMSGRLTTNMLIGSAVCQTPAIFSLVLAMMLLFLDFGRAAVSPTWAALLGAGICMGFGAIGSGIGSGYPGGEACLGIAKQPAVSGRLTTTMLIGSAVCQTPAIFSMVVALMLLFSISGMPLLPRPGLRCSEQALPQGWRRSAQGWAAAWPRGPVAKALPGIRRPSAR